jgi:predicted amidohydrolase YtcJ
MKKILVPTDFSTFSLNALGVAADIAKKANAEVILLHIVDYPIAAHHLEDFLETETGKELTKKINQQFLEVLQLKSMQGVNISTHVHYNSMIKGIHHFADKEKVDVIYFNGQVYTVDSSLSKQEAFAIKDGQFIAVGSTIFIEKNYESTTKIDLKQQFVYPGLIDAHSHFYGLGRFMQMVDLTGAKSWDECVERCKNFYETNKPSVLLGRGWDQNLWAKKDFPSNEKLNELFKNIPVLLKRVDGHAAIVNDFTLKLANINSTTEVNGGKVILQKNQPTGVLIDNAVDLVENVLPEISVADKIKALKIAEKHCFEYGLTSVCDAGLDLPIIHLIDSLQQQNLLKMY